MRTRTESCSLSLPHSPTSVSRARGFTVRTLASWGVSDPVDDITLCVSELATNALLHGRTPGHRFVVRLQLGPALRLEVHDSNPRPATLRAADPYDPSGRGLFLVNELADRWGCCPRRGPGKAVWAEFDLPGADPAA
ncbi:hypothetical protein SRB5_47910 [Streptomyces sp. RB5]|uniref:Histidine kinase/HSP90-like ATPase domain-containing protein n=1 Tax=Streptomyces smaragdinus TaxID=2585196 RepID=A0A7K0CMX7_9ACTN|nr:ATP-binding protein [Streptomyces smaragdinus]MQY14623.1 hypothetical protein [Streptomyces smaragdinus]